MFIFYRGQHTIAIYGEHDKYVPMSPQRITDIIYTETDMVLEVAGVASENVTISYLMDGQLKHITQVFSSSGTSMISLIQGKPIKMPVRYHNNWKPNNRPNGDNIFGRRK